MADFQCASKIGSLGMHLRGRQGQGPTDPEAHLLVGLSNREKTWVLCGMVGRGPRGAWGTVGAFSATDFALVRRIGYKRDRARSSISTDGAATNQPRAERSAALGLVLTTEAGCHSRVAASSRA